MKFKTTVQGIPCICEVLVYIDEPAQIWGPPELCHPGEFEFEYQLLDQKGYRAEWLERKITDEDDQRIFEEFQNEL